MKSMADFKYHFGLHMKAYPSDQQKHIINLNISAARFVYNEMISLSTKIYNAKQVKGVKIGIVERDLKHFSELRKSTPAMTNIHHWLQNPKIDSLAISNAKKNYRTSWKNYREQHKNGTPRYKTAKNYKGSYQTSPQYGKKTEVSVYTPTVRFVDPQHMKLPKVGVIRVAGSQRELFKRKTDIRLGTVTISHDNCMDYFISVQLASDTPFVKVPTKTGKSIGVDLNLSNFLTESNNSMVANPRFYEHAKPRIRHASQKLSRRKVRAENEHRKLRFAQNYQKQRIIYAKRCRRVKNQRKDHINNITKQLLTNYDFIAAENLLSKNMLKNHRLAAKISDVGWGIFLMTMTYKAELYDKKFVMVDPRNTTQMCSKCGTIMGHNGYKKIGLNIREWTCPKCGYKHIRDANAAINILKRGLEMNDKQAELQKNKVTVETNNEDVLVGETGKTKGTLTVATIKH